VNGPATDNAVCVCQMVDVAKRSLIARQRNELHIICGVSRDIVLNELAWGYLRIAKNAAGLFVPFVLLAIFAPLLLVVALIVFFGRALAA
jgi:hypothetical protein